LVNIRAKISWARLAIYEEKTGRSEVKDRAFPAPVAVGPGVATSQSLTRSSRLQLI
jgi:hypothetical protein